MKTPQLDANDFKTRRLRISDVLRDDVGRDKLLREACADTPIVTQLLTRSAMASESFSEAPSPQEAEDIRRDLIVVLALRGFERAHADSCAVPHSFNSCPFGKPLIWASKAFNYWLECVYVTVFGFPDQGSTTLAKATVPPPTSIPIPPNATPWQPPGDPFPIAQPAFGNGAASHVQKVPLSTSHAAHGLNPEPGS